MDNKLTEEFLFFSQNSRWPSVKGQKSLKFDFKNHISARHLDPVCLIWKKNDMDRLLDDKNKPAEISFFNSKIAIEGLKLNFGKFWAKNDILARQTDIVHPIWTIFGRKILLGC